MRLPWSWGSKVNDQLILDGLISVRHLVVGRVLDLGCGKKPYRAPLGSNAETWIGLDYQDTPSGRSAADVFASALEIPFSAAAFDTVLSTQVLEHVRQPPALFREAFRVLRPGGHFVISAPQTNPLHEEPHDYFRFTCYGLQLLAADAGFQVVQVMPLGGAIATIGQVSIWHMGWLARIPIVGSALRGLGTTAVSWITLTLDPLSRIYGRGALKDTLNWLLVARKPES